MQAEFVSPGIQELTFDEIDAVNGGLSDLATGLLILGAGVVIGVAAGGIVGAVVIAAML
jgi:hypothetical protein